MNLNGYIESARAIFDRYPEHLDFIKSVSLQQSIHYFTSEYLSSLWKDKGYADLFIILTYIEMIVCDYDMDVTSYKIIVSELNVTILTLYDQSSLKVKEMIY